MNLIYNFLSLCKHSLYKVISLVFVLVAITGLVVISSPGKNLEVQAQTYPSQQIAQADIDDDSVGGDESAATFNNNVTWIINFTSAAIWQINNIALVVVYFIVTAFIFFIRLNPAEFSNSGVVVELWQVFFGLASLLVFVSYLFIGIGKILGISKVKIGNFLVSSIIILATINLTLFLTATIINVSHGVTEVFIWSYASVTPGSAVERDESVQTFNLDDDAVVARVLVGDFLNSLGQASGLRCHDGKNSNSNLTNSPDRVGDGECDILINANGNVLQVNTLGDTAPGGENDGQGNVTFQSKILSNNIGEGTLFLAREAIFLGVMVAAAVAVWRFLLIGVERFFFLAISMPTSVFALTGLLPLPGVKDLGNWWVKNFVKYIGVYPLSVITLIFTGIIIKGITGALSGLDDAINQTFNNGNSFLGITAFAQNSEGGLVDAAAPLLSGFGGLAAAVMFYKASGVTNVTSELDLSGFSRFSPINRFRADPNTSNPQANNQTFSLNSVRRNGGGIFGGIRSLAGNIATQAVVGAATGGAGNTGGVLVGSNGLPRIPTNINFQKLREGGQQFLTNLQARTTKLNNFSASMQEVPRIKNFADKLNSSFVGGGANGTNPASTPTSTGNNIDTNIGPLKSLRNDEGDTTTIQSITGEIESYQALDAGNNQLPAYTPDPNNLTPTNLTTDKEKFIELNNEIVKGYLNPEDIDPESLPNIPNEEGDNRYESIFNNGSTTEIKSDESEDSQGNDNLNGVDYYSTYQVQEIPQETPPVAEIKSNSSKPATQIASTPNPQPTPSQTPVAKVTKIQKRPTGNGQSNPQTGSTGGKQSANSDNNKNKSNTSFTASQTFKQKVVTPTQESQTGSSTQQAQKVSTPNPQPTPSQTPVAEINSTSNKPTSTTKTQTPATQRASNARTDTKKIKQKQPAKSTKTSGGQDQNILTTTKQPNEVKKEVIAFNSRSTLNPQSKPTVPPIIARNSTSTPAIPTQPNSAIETNQVASNSTQKPLQGLKGFDPNNNKKA